MEETIKKLRAIFLANLNRQLKSDTGISTRINLYNEGKQVHSTFVKAADDYIQSYGLEALLKGQE